MLPSHRTNWAQRYPISRTDTSAKAPRFFSTSTGWFADPNNSAQLRYWCGSHWTGEITPNWTKERDDIWVEETMNAMEYKFAVEMVKRYKKMGYKIVIAAARGQSCKENTVKKLKEIEVRELVDTMLHRTGKYENARSAVWKKAVIKMLKQKYAFMLALEDEDGNTKVMRRHGMTVVDARIWHYIE